jgi:hypothetical protein
LARRAALARRGLFCYTEGKIMMTWDLVIAGLIGLIDLNPLLDLIFTPLAWALLFFVG